MKLIFGSQCAGVCDLASHFFHSRPTLFGRQLATKPLSLLCSNSLCRTPLSSPQTLETSLGWTNNAHGEVESGNAEWHAGKGARWCGRRRHRTPAWPTPERGRRQ